MLLHAPQTLSSPSFSFFILHNQSPQILVSPGQFPSDSLFPLCFFIAVILCSLRSDYWHRHCLISLGNDSSGDIHLLKAPTPVCQPSESTYHSIIPYSSDPLIFTEIRTKNRLLPASTHHLTLMPGVCSFSCPYRYILYLPLFSAIHIPQGLLTKLFTS